MMSIKNPVKALTENPILINELRLRMRGKRAFLVLAAHLILLSAIVFLVYLAVYEDTQSYGRYSYAGNFQRALEASSNAGQAIFYGTSMLLLLFVSIIAPAFTAGALVGEKERQTYDLLTITTLSARAIVAGKLYAIMTFLTLLIMATLPILTMAYFFGGVTIGEVLISILVLIITALVFSSIGLFVSSFARSTTAANLTTYAIVIPLLLGVPFFVFVFGILSSGIFLDGFLTDDPPLLMAAVITYVAFFFLSINPLSMAVTS
ncbi:MAG: ABC transporter permease subunit, partial [Chloroflexota bacterium]